MRKPRTPQHAMFSYQTLEDQIPSNHLFESCGYDRADFEQAMLGAKVTPQVVAIKSDSAIDGQTTRHASYAFSLKKRKLVEEIIGWAKTIGGLRRTRFIGLVKVTSQTVFIFACYNLTRMATLFG